MIVKWFIKTFIALVSSWFFMSAGVAFDKSTFWAVILSIIGFLFMDAYAYLLFKWRK